MTKFLIGLGVSPVLAMTVTRLLRGLVVALTLAALNYLNVELPALLQDSTVGAVLVAVYMALDKYLRECLKDATVE